MLNESQVIASRKEHGANILTPPEKESLWKQFVQDSRYAGEEIGAYQGGLTYPTGVWRPTLWSVMNQHHVYGTFNAPSRAQIYTRIMKLSEGQDWQFDYETFVAWDQAHPAKMSAALPTKSNYGAIDKAESEGHVPPVILNRTWRQVINECSFPLICR